MITLTYFIGGKFLTMTETDFNSDITHHRVIQNQIINIFRCATR